MSSLTTIARGAGILLPATLLGNAMGLVLDVALNGLLGNASYGLLGAARRLVGFGGFAGQLGLENAVLRFVALAPDDAAALAVTRRAALLAVAASGLLALLVLLFARPVAAWLDPHPQAGLVVLFAALALPFAALRTVMVAASQARKVLSHRAWVMFLVWPPAQLLGVVLLRPAWALPAAGAVAGFTLAVAVGALLATGLHLRLYPPGLGAGAGGAGLRTLLAFSWPGWLQGMLMAAYTWGDQVLLAGIRSAEEAGWYGPVAALAPLFGIGLTALNGVFAPIIAQRHAEGDRAGLQALYRTVTRWGVSLAVPPVVLCLVAPEQVLDIWPDGSPLAANALRIVALGQLLGVAVGSVNYLLLMAGHPRATLWNGIPAVVLSLGLSAWWIPIGGVTGAAAANAVAFGAANLLALGQVWVLLRVHPFDRRLLKPLVAGVGPALVAAGVVALAPAGGVGLVEAPLAAVLGGLTFLGLLLGLGLDADDRVVVDAVRRRLGR